MSEHESQHLYDGPSRLESEQGTWEVDVALRGVSDIDPWGRFRIAGTGKLSREATPTVEVRMPAPRPAASTTSWSTDVMRREEAPRR